MFGIDEDSFWFGVCAVFFLVCTVMSAVHGHWVQAWVCLGMAWPFGRLVWAELRPARDDD